MVVEGQNTLKFIVRLFGRALVMAQGVRQRLERAASCKRELRRVGERETALMAPKKFLQGLTASRALELSSVAALSLVWTKQRPNGWVVNIPGQAGSPRTQQAG